MKHAATAVEFVPRELLRQSITSKTDIIRGTREDAAAADEPEIGVAKNKTKKGKQKIRRKRGTIQATHKGPANTSERESAQRGKWGW